MRSPQIVASHVVDASALRSDDFNAFFVAREAALLARIERAIGKRVMRASLQTIEEEQVTDLDEEAESASV